MQRLKRTDDTCVSVWDIGTGKLNNYRAREGNTRLELNYGVALSPDSRFLAARLKNQDHNPHSLQIWDVTTWERLKMRNLVSENLSSLTWSPDGNFLAYICSGIIEPWDLRTDELEILYREQAPPCNIAFSSNSQQLAYLTAGYDLGLVDITMRTTIGKQKLHLDTVGEAVWLRFSDDDQILYTPKGRIDIASFSSDGAKPTTNRSSIVEDGWVIHGSQKVFRFPVGDKVRFSPVIEDTLIVGYESGRVDLLEFNGGS